MESGLKLLLLRFVKMFLTNKKTLPFLHFPGCCCPHEALTVPLQTRLTVKEVPHSLSEIKKKQNSEIKYLLRCYLQLIYIKSFKLVKIDESLKKENEYAIKIKEGKIYISKALYVRHIFQMYAFMYLCCNPGSWKRFVGSVQYRSGRKAIIFPERNYITACTWCFIQRIEYEIIFKCYKSEVNLNSYVSYGMET